MEILESLVNKDNGSLKELQIVKFNQRKQENLGELLKLGKFKALERLNLCSTWFPLQVKVASGEDGADVSGSRDLERIMWGLKNNIKNLILGNYLWDDILVYIGEICKELEVV